MPSLRASASPDREAGRGLKQRSRRGDEGHRRASPDREAGRGLKPLDPDELCRRWHQASPDREAGRGLKHCADGEASVVLPHRPTVRPGAD